jgi:rhamnopyranosyl-N-acetylglucosaminyl-diphospho-decaprenol beta-1,3/1,4-galactofuranosyltransferase
LTDDIAERVAAVVVNYNAGDALGPCVASVLAQEPRPEIVVVDNASTDGTADATTALASIVPVHVVRLEENTGGAGGFHTGLEVALERGADLVWLMDDDGVPEPSCLETLLPHLTTHEFVGPAVVAEDAPDRLCFPIRLPGGTRVVHRMDALRAAAVDGLVEGILIPFNGVLVTRQLVELIGTPRAEFFIWGDDVEYLWRAEAAGARIATVVDARVLHPATDDLGTPMMFGRTTYNHSPSDLKHYCMARNNTVNLRRYRGWPHVLMFWAKTVWFYLLTQPRPARLPMSMRAAYAGLRGDFTGHRRYLR